MLIVDDEPVNIYLLARMLKDSYAILEARSGEEALRIARGPQRPALILLDVMMPEIDGFEVCRQLKADDATKDIIVIFVTAIGDSAAEEIGLNLGAADYITKPISLPIVRARVRNQMSMRLKADMLEQMSYIDGLTHVYNRRKFDSVLLQEWQRSLCNGHPLAVIMIDFDHFKALNDHYGHGAGDICLQQGAAALVSVLKRQSDLLARYGGEEFVAVLPDTDLSGARLTAEDMRQAVKSLNLTHHYSPAADHVTVSLGVAATVATEERRATELVEFADRALRRAKSSGRDRVETLEILPIDGAGAAENLPLPEPSDDALLQLEPDSAQTLAGTAADALWQPEERRRYPDAGVTKSPQLDAVLASIGELYQLPLSAELIAEVDRLFAQANQCVERLRSDANEWADAEASPLSESD